MASAGCRINADFVKKVAFVIKHGVEMRQDCVKHIKADQGYEIMINPLPRPVT